MTPELEALERLRACPFHPKGCEMSIERKEHRHLNSLSIEYSVVADCGARGPGRFGKDEAIESWNTRTDPTPRPWLRAEEVTEEGWYWVLYPDELRVVCLKSDLGQLYYLTEDFRRVRKTEMPKADWQRIPEPELPEES